jgi:threonine synthase
VTELPGLRAACIDPTCRSLWRYREALPFGIEHPVTLGEGCTPMIRKAIGGATCHLKLEWFSPTGSFKDRGAAVMVSVLHKAGVTAVQTDSSGNAGASLAAYGAAAGMSVRIFVPQGAQPAKIAQISAFGAQVEVVPGSRRACEELAMQPSNESFIYASHNWSPFFLHGTKTLGYEIWEELNFCVPDFIVMPVGGGSNLLGCDLAFNELLRAGETERLPRLIAVQPVNCAPVHAAFEHRRGRKCKPIFSHTIAEGASIRRPVRLAGIIDAIERSGGGTVAVDESQIVSGLRLLAQEGLLVEPTSALAMAGYLSLRETSRIPSGATTVVILTGTGLKVSSLIAEILSSLPSGA